MNTVDPRRVMVIHGRCEKLRRSVFDMLSDMGLRPQTFPQLNMLHGTGSNFTFDVVMNAIDQVQAVVAILYGEERVEPIPELSLPAEAGLQPRPNVIFEVGVALRLKRQQTILLQIGGIREWSDIAGIQRLMFDGDPSQRLDLFNRLGAIGCDIDRSKTDFLQPNRYKFKCM